MFEIATVHGRLPHVVLLQITVVVQSYGVNLKAYGENLKTYGVRNKGLDWVEALPATSRHTRPKRGLLPSGSDPLHKIALRENQ